MISRSLSCRDELRHRLTAAVETYLLGLGVRGYQVTVAPQGEAREHLTVFYDRLGFTDEGRGILWRKLEP